MTAEDDDRALPADARGALLTHALLAVPAADAAAWAERIERAVEARPERASVAMEAPWEWAWHARRAWVGEGSVAPSSDDDGDD